MLRLIAAILILLPLAGFAAEAAADEAAASDGPPVRVAVKPIGADSITLTGDDLDTAWTRERDEMEIAWRGGAWYVNGTRIAHDEVKITKDGVAHLGDIVLAGELSLAVRDGRPALVHTLPMERYLPGVIASEVHPDWNLELFKVQATIARTYALKRVAAKPPGYDLWGTTADQVWKGRKTYPPDILKAVDQTRGMAVTWQGAIIDAFYHSTCGGHTEDGGEVFQTRAPYLKGRPDEYCTESPRQFWSAEFTHTELARAFTEAGFAVTPPVRIEVAAKNESGRASLISVSGSTGQHLVPGNEFRRILGYSRLRSTMISIRDTADGVKILGSGSGHGVGLCQWGAKVMSERGFAWRDILQYYYSGAAITAQY